MSVTIPITVVKDGSNVVQFKVTLSHQYLNELVGLIDSGKLCVEIDP